MSGSFFSMVVRRRGAGFVTGLVSCGTAEAKDRLATAAMRLVVVVVVIVVE
jgi:hypothetical protein